MTRVHHITLLQFLAQNLLPKRWWLKILSLHKQHIYWFQSNFSSTVQAPVPHQEEVCVTTKREHKVECPLCYCHFSSKDIESHASDCQGQSVTPQASSFNSVPQQLEDAIIGAEFAGSRYESVLTFNPFTPGLKP